MTPEEIEKKLAEAGKALGEWQDFKGGYGKPAFLQEQAKALMMLRSMLEAEQAKHMEKLGELRMKLAKLKKTTDV